MEPTSSHDSHRLRRSRAGSGARAGLAAALAAAALWPAASAARPLPTGEVEEFSPDGPDPVKVPLSAAAICRGGERLLEVSSDDAIRQAALLFEAAARHHPDSACGHAGLAWALVALHNRQLEPGDEAVDRARAAAERAIALEPRSARAAAALAVTRLADLRPEEAERSADAALALEPDLPDALLAAAQVRIARRRLGLAREASDRLLALRPDLPSAHLVSGNLSLLSGEPAAAILEYDLALALSPDFTPADLQRAIAYAERGELRASARIFDRLLERRKETTSLAHVYMAQSLMKRNSFNAALAVLDRAGFSSRRGLCDGTVLYMKALCLERLGRRDEARSAYREVIARWPDATAGTASTERLGDEAYEALGRMLLQDGAPQEAVAVMEEGAARPAAGADLCLRLARLFGEYRMPEKALGLLERAADRDPDPRDITLQMSAYVGWARAARAAGDERSLSRLRESLRGRAAALRELRDFPHDLEAARALSIAGTGEVALEWLRHAAELGYTHFGWIRTDPDFEAVRRTPGWADLAKTAAEDTSR